MHVFFFCEVQFKSVKPDCPRQQQKTANLWQVIRVQSGGKARDGLMHTATVNIHGPRQHSLPCIHDSWKTWFHVALRVAGTRAFWCYAERHHIHGASGPGPATYKIKRLFDDVGAQQPKQRARKTQVLPMLLGKKPPMDLCKKPPCKEHPKIKPQNHPANCKDWSKIFACKGSLASGATGMVFFSAPWKYKKRQSPWNESWNPTLMRRWCMIFFGSSRSWKRASIPTSRQCFPPTKCRFRHLLWSCRERHFVGGKHCRNVRMLTVFTEGGGRNCGAWCSRCCH